MDKKRLKLLNRKHEELDEPRKSMRIHHKRQQMALPHHPLIAAIVQQNNKRRITTSGK